MNAAARAGLAVVNVGRGVDLPALLRRHKSGFSRAFPPLPDAPDHDDETSVFTELCDVMADGVVEAADRWRADLIVYTPEAAAALVAATKLDIPAVFFCIGLGHTPALMAARYARCAKTPATCDRHGVSTFASPLAWIDLSPPSLRRERSDGWAMRYVQYNGGQQLDAAPPGGARPRVAVTLGTMVPQVFGVHVFRGIVDAARQVDATFVIAYGSDNARDLGPLPPNVEAHSWMPLDALVATSSAAIHHGGFGTTLAMLAAGLPQLVLPHGADQFFNADVLRRRGAALIGGELVSGHEIDTAESIRRLLTDRELHGVVEEVSAEIAAMPSPAEIVPQLTGLVH